MRIVTRRRDLRTALCKTQVSQYISHPPKIRVTLTKNRHRLLFASKICSLFLSIVSSGLCLMWQRICYGTVWHYTAKVVSLVSSDLCQFWRRVCDGTIGPYTAKEVSLVSLGLWLIWRKIHYGTIELSTAKCFRVETQYITTFCNHGIVHLTKPNSLL